MPTLHEERMSTSEGFHENHEYRVRANFEPFEQPGYMVVNEGNIKTHDSALFVYPSGFDRNIEVVIWSFSGNFNKMTGPPDFAFSTPAITPFRL